MNDIRYQTLTAVSVVLFFGTAYSVLYNTYLDTSNPLLTHLPHPLAKTDYFATKSNPLNVYFIKKAWGWTTVSFLLTFLTSPEVIRTKDRIFKYLALTGIWILFTNWFFGAPILDRVTVFSGGECIAHLPTGGHITVPHELCYNHLPLTPQTHPDLFSTAALLSPEVQAKLHVVPRLRKGHDMSGHIFLLTMSILFLVDQLRPSFGQRAYKTWSTVHSWAVAAQIALVAIWFLAEYTTAVYFHSPFEKFTGYLLGVASFGVSQIFG
ncbi:Fat storage-inducing transmembrane protein [Crepidotus variabilis]|uniref:Fat storage-inducing transmembrane protein n=1 Tax=Crepidotus variabilis TaxID=179855 RepID=A0A9P6ECT2_9AGAR|nr:Fat storage-inducing transmembrane protein [Crepidotus variabilis]